MKKIFFLLLLPSIVSFDPSNRTPAGLYEESTTRQIAKYDVVDSLKKACETISEGQDGYEMCLPYIRAKKDVEKRGQEVVDTLNDYVPVEVSGITGVVLKSLYEQQIRLDVKTGFGEPGISISTKETLLKWNWEYKF